MIGFKIDHVEKTARNRSIFFSIPNGLKIIYYGDGNGFESVRINGKTANAVKSKLWYAKKVPFMLPLNGQSIPAYIEVSVRWFKIKSLRLVVQSEVIYSEGEFADAPTPAESFVEKDFSLLDKKLSKKQAIISLALAGLIFLALPFLRIETEWNLPYTIAFKYLALPLLLLALIAPLTFPKVLDRQLGRTYLLFGEKMKAAFRFGLSLSFAFVALMLSGQAIAGLNAYLKPGIPTLIKGQLEDIFESGNKVIATINTTERQFKVPMDACIGRTVQKGDKVETALLEGAFGIYYFPTSVKAWSQLDAFFLERLEDGRWVRQSNVKSAMKTKDVSWLKSLSEKWKAKCDNGDAPNCRLFSYYLSEIHGPEEKDFLERSCNGNDAVGCYGLSLIDATSADEKKQAVTRIFDLCKTHLPTCYCYWEEFEKYIHGEQLKVRKSELCTSGQRWAC
ncbi:MAG: hypothetical protein ACXWRE_01280 [Pseudobdellovibrionaceae bacterium]